MAKRPNQSEKVSGVHCHGVKKGGFLQLRKEQYAELAARALQEEPCHTLAARRRPGQGRWGPDACFAVASPALHAVGHSWGSSTVVFSVLLLTALP